MTTDETTAAARLATAVAARLIHDAMGPASGIVSAFDLIADPAAAAMRDEALALAAASARTLVALLKVSRIVQGGGAAVGAEVAGLAHSLFEESRAELRLEEISLAATPEANRLLLGLLQIAQTVAASGGTVIGRVARTEGTLSVTVEARGPRLRLTDDMRAGFAGAAPPPGAAPRWANACLLRAAAEAAGGDIAVQPFEGGVLFRADIKAEAA